MKMKTIIIPILIISILSAIVAAKDLSDYPDYFVEDDSLNVVIVVGNKAPATHVIAQTQIALSLSQLVSERTVGLSKLASDIDSIDNLNIISIGSACINKITSDILDNPEPCDKNLAANKATIEFYEKENNVYIILNAITDEGIKKSAAILSNYKDYNLDDNVFEIVLEEETKVPEQEEEQIEEEEPVLISEEVMEEETEDEEEAFEEQETGPEPILKEEDDLIKRFISWLFSLFR